MEQQQRSLVFTAAVGLIILAIIVGSIYYLVKFIQGRVSSSSQTSQTQNEQITGTSNPDENVQNPQTIEFGSANPEGQIPQAGSNVAPDERSSSSSEKVFNSGDFQLVYPKSWGIVTCTNSANVELDPNNAADTSLACDLAIKPVTIVVSDIKGCEGETAKVGNIEVVKSQATQDGYTKYQWCTKTTPVLNITHRVSQGGERATSTRDFSKQIEDMIASLSFTHGS